MKTPILLLLASTLVHAQRIDVPAERLVNALKEPRNWLTYWGDYSGIRHRALNQINASNAKDLRLDWIFQVPVGGRFETVPLIVDGVMFLTAPTVGPSPSTPAPAANSGATTTKSPRKPSSSTAPSTAASPFSTTSST